MSIIYLDKWRTSGLFFVASLFGALAGAASPDDRGKTSPLMAEVRVFEIRRLNSDFSPIEDLSFLVDSDGSNDPPLSE